MDAESMPTEIGPLLVGTVEQTVLDLARRRWDRPDFEAERAAVLALAPRVDRAVLGEIALGQRRTTALRRVEELLEVAGT